MDELGKLRALIATTCLAFLASCATTPQSGGPQYAPVASALHEARSSQVPVEKRAADYLRFAAMTASLLGGGTKETPPLDAYNSACAELTMLLRSADSGRLWNHSITVTDGSATYRLNFEPGSYAVWAPDNFTSFKLPGAMKNEGRVKRLNQVQGVGGALVGVHLGAG